MTPKATVRLVNLQNGFKAENVSTSGIATFKHKKDDFTFQLALTDNTARDVASKKDLLGTVDYKLNKSLKLTGIYDFGASKFRAGGTWEGKKAMVKVTYLQASSNIAGEASYNLSSKTKATVTFDRKQLLTGKIAFQKGSLLFDPTYNFAKKTTTLSATKKFKSKSLKGTYEIQTGAAGVELNVAPVKFIATSTVKGIKVSNPVVSAVFEKTYDL